MKRVYVLIMPLGVEGGEREKDIREILYFFLYKKVRFYFIEILFRIKVITCPFIKNIPL